MEQNSYLGTDNPPMVAPTSDEKTMAILAHALTLVVWIFAPLIIYLVKKDESGFVREHAKESLNFQITLYIVLIGLFITIIGILLMWIVGLVALVLVIIASIKASEGKVYRYPFTLRLIK
ncbi:MAG: DUF4870 domain-containing protein [Bacteroidota bacterium]|nr:DUF4870 domain-containing protein [Ferruginibacter sp.]